MKRKLIKQRDSYTITLPIKWVKKFNLAKNAEIEVSEVKEGLLLSSDSKRTKKEATVNLKISDPRFIRRMLFNYYNAGYDRVTISGKISEKEVFREISLVTGFEITSKGKDYFVVECISELAEDSISKLMKQLFFMAHQNMLEFMNAAMNKKRPDFEIIKMNSERILKNCNLCLRIINKGMKPFDAFNWTITIGIMWIDRQIYYLCQNILLQKPIDLKKEVSEYLNLVIDSFNRLYNGIYTNSMDDFERILEDYKKCEKEKLKILPNQPQYISAILNAFSQINYLTLRLSGEGIGLASLAQDSGS